jgi:hypothetical protein
MFDGQYIFSPFGEVWFGAEDTEPFADLSDLTVRKVVVKPFPTGTPDQLERSCRNPALNRLCLPTNASSLRLRKFRKMNDNRWSGGWKGCGC